MSDITNTLKETPTKYEILNQFMDISDKWYDIGVILKVPHSVLDDIKHSWDDSNEKNLSKVVDNWITTPSFPVTWEAVITVIESPTINNNKKADKIRYYLKLRKLLLVSNEFFFNFHSFS